MRTSKLAKRIVSAALSLLLLVFSVPSWASEDPACDPEEGALCPVQEAPAEVCVPDEGAQEPVSTASEFPAEGELSSDEEIPLGLEASPADLGTGYADTDKSGLPAIPEATEEVAEEKPSKSEAPAEDEESAKDGAAEEGDISENSEPADDFDAEFPEESLLMELLSVPAPSAGLKSLQIASSANADQAVMFLYNPGEAPEGENEFSPGVSYYTLKPFDDTLVTFYFTEESYDSSAKIEVVCPGASKTLVLKGGQTKSWSSTLQKGEIAPPGRSSFTIKVTESSGDITEYHFATECLPTLKGLQLFAGESELSLNSAFDPLITGGYSVQVPLGTESLSLTASVKKTGSSISVNGSTDLSAIDISGCDELRITACSDDGTCSRTYTVTLEKTAPLGFRISPVPSNATVQVYDKNGIELAPDDTGLYTALFQAGGYTYKVSMDGYIPQSGDVPLAGGELPVELEKTADSDQPEEVPVDWSNFRNSDDNMGITEIELPTEEDSVSLLWSTRFGEGWADAPSVQIIVDNSLVVMAGTTLYKLDLKTGEILAQAEMVAKPNWGYTPPSYGGGMIFCPLTDGTIQAFNAKTLASLWVYRDPLGGQSLSPITYSNGYIYTGFWTGEKNNANYVCIKTADENPKTPDESKSAVWSYTNKGGFYWAGSIVLGDFLIVGTEDGVSSGGDSSVLSIRKDTGAVVSAITLPSMGDVRASIAWAKDKGRIYFCAQQAYLCSAAVDTATGVLSDLKYYKEDGQATSTPLVYKNRVYYGIGSGISTSGSSGSFVVADADTLETIYTIPLRGYPQCSQLMSTAAEGKGYLYFYSTYNSKPGGITLIRIDPTKDSAAEGAFVSEIYEAEGHEEYCISSLICGPDGTIYYKNDSGCVLAVGIPATDNVIRLIGKIDEEITADSGAAIGAARAAYNALTPAQQAEVTNYAALTAAEEAYAEIRKAIEEEEKKKQEEEEKAKTATGNTKVITGDGTKENVTVDGVVYKVDKTAAQLIRQIVTLQSQGEKASEDSILAAFRTYDAMTDALKIQIINYSVLEDLCAALGTKYHSDAEGNPVCSNLPWYVKVEIFEADDDETADLDAAARSLGSTALKCFRLSLSNVLTGESYDSDEELTFLLSPAQYSSETGSGADHEGKGILSLSADGRPEIRDAVFEDGMLQLQASGSGLFAYIEKAKAATGVLPEDPAEEESLLLSAASEEPAAVSKKGTDVLPFIIGALGGAGITLMTVVFFSRRKNDDEDE